MFLWFSSGNGRTRWGCCGGFLLLPLGLLPLLGGFDHRLLLLLLVIGLILAAVFVLPQLGRTQAEGEKPKNDSMGDEPFVGEKPKRTTGDRWADDGEGFEG